MRSIKNHRQVKSKVTIEYVKIIYFQSIINFQLRKFGEMQIHLLNLENFLLSEKSKGVFLLNCASMCLFKDTNSVHKYLTDFKEQEFKKSNNDIINYYINIQFVN